MINLNQLKLFEPVPDSGPEWTLLAAGDFYGINRFSEKSYTEDVVSQIVTKELLDLVADANVAIVNMEGPVQTLSISISKSGPVIQMDAAAPFVLKRIGFDLVSLANNHIMDYGAQGLASTVEACRKEGLVVCGAGRDEREAMEPVRPTINGGVYVSILAFCEREFGAAGRGNPGSAWISDPLALKKVADVAKTSDVVIVLAHGGVEEVPFSPIQRQTQLRQFIDAGATLVIGHHPHVPQGWERYKKGMIFYSLGNFLFDYPDGKRRPKTEWGLMIQARFCGAVLCGIELIPVSMSSNGRIGRLGESCDEEKYLRYLHLLSDLTTESDTLIPYWQETVVHLWSKRYLPYLQYAYLVDDSGYADTIRSHLSGLYRGIRRRIRWQHQPKGPTMASQIKDGLLLLNLIRNESHRWAIETALAVLYGDEKDRRTPEVKAEFDRLLSWTEE